GAIFLKIQKAQSPLGNPGSPAPFADRSFLLLPPRQTSPLSLSALHSTDIKQKIFEKHRLLIH
ncbi:hypothetical protein, partial [Butyricicoccus sp.]|uniref:hypothetical protein n=1 Tax=Butyricicoccus sp. TaxID=2049021 RepID=UPI003AB0FF59